MISRCLRRPGLAVLLVAAAVAATLLPPSHIHLAIHDHDDDHHDHDHAVSIEHSHWSGHHAFGSAVADGDDEGRVLFVDHPALVRTAHGHVAVPQAAVIALLTLLYQPIFEPGGQRAAGNAPRDGPRRQPPPLRGPPISSFR